MKIYVTVTDHCRKQIIDRHPECKDSKTAIKFGIDMFTKLIIDGENEGKKARMIYSRNGKYKITDGVNQFVYAKPYKIEYVLVTYVKREFKLGKNLRPKETYVERKF